MHPAFNFFFGSVYLKLNRIWVQPCSGLNFRIQVSFGSKISARLQLWFNKFLHIEEGVNFLIIFYAHGILQLFITLIQDEIFV